jgi:hypothetical protein
MGHSQQLNCHCRQGATNLYGFLWQAVVQAAVLYRILGWRQRDGAKLAQGCDFLEGSRAGA